jgi:hypothetical protein
MVIGFKEVWNLAHQLAILALEGVGVDIITRAVAEEVEAGEEEGGEAILIHPTCLEKLHNIPNHL